MNKSRKSKKGKPRAGKSVQDLVELLLNVDTARTIVGSKHLFKHEDGGELTAPEGVQPMEGPGPKPAVKKAMPKKAPAKKPYDLDSEIPFVLKAKSSFDEDATFQDLIKNASKKTGVDSKLLFASSLQEGMNKAALQPDEISEAYKAAGKKNPKLDDFPVDGFYNYGLDRFGEMAPELIKKGYLPKDLEYSVFDAQNEKKENIKTAAFRNNQDALVAKAAVLKNERDKVLAYAKNKGITLTPETNDYFTLAAYNAGMGNAQKMMDEYQQQGGKGTDFITKDQTTRKGVSKNVIPRYNRISKVKDFFEHGGEIKKLKQLTSFENPIAQDGITIPNPAQGDEMINKQFALEQSYKMAEPAAFDNRKMNTYNYGSGASFDNRKMNTYNYGDAASFDDKSNIGVPNPAAGDKEIGKNFLNSQLAQVQRQQRDLSIGATELAPKTISTQAPTMVTPQEEQPYQGPNPFQVGLTAAAAIVGREQTPRYYNRPEDSLYYNPKPQGTGSQAIMKQGGEIMNVGSLEFPIYRTGGHIRENMSYEQGGELQLFDADHGANPISENINGNPVIQFDGPSHEDGGIPISFMGNEVEVEGGETGFKRQNGSFEVLGNLRNPLTGRLFKNDGKMIAKQENRYTKMLDKGMGMVEDNNPDDAFERLKFNTGKAKMMGAKDNLDKLSLLKESIAEIQEQKLAIANDLGIKPLDVDKAKYGKMITAEWGWEVDPVTGTRKKVTRGSSTAKKTVKPKSEQPKQRQLETVEPTANKPLGVIPPQKLKTTAPIIGIPEEEVKAQPKVSDLNYQPRQPIESDAEGFDYTNLLGEAYALGTNRLEPVQMQKYRPELEQAYNVSFQDRINRNSSTFRAMQQQLGNNPAALATIAGQTAAADSGVLADEFRTNQAMSADVYNRNRQVMNDAQLKNLGIQDQQYVRQEQARANTKRRTFDALSSISEKFLKHKAGQQELRVLENLYDYRFDKNYVAQYKGAAQNWRQPIVQGADADKEVKPAEKAKKGKMGMNLTKEFKHYK